MNYLQIKKTEKLISDEYELNVEKCVPRFKIYHFKQGPWIFRHYRRDHKVIHDVPEE
jgi:hypothetical protein